MREVSPKLAGLTGHDYFMAGVALFLSLTASLLCRLLFRQYPHVPRKALLFQLLATPIAFVLIVCISPIFAIYSLWYSWNKMDVRYQLIAASKGGLRIVKDQPTAGTTSSLMH